MRIDLPPGALNAGMSNEPVGTHTSRTLMFRELSDLLAGCPSDAAYETYAAAIVDDNLLQKRSLATRRKTLRHLRELYALRDDVPVFAGLRALWTSDTEGRPLIALLCAMARDPLLRCTLEVITDLPIGSRTDAATLSAEVASSFPGRYTPGVVGRIGRNVASSWTQSGHLTGRVHKARTMPHATPAAVAYALYLGHLCGGTGTALLNTPWTAALDTTETDARRLAAVASRLGWISYRSAADVTELTFRQLDAMAKAMQTVPA